MSSPQPPGSLPGGLQLDDGRRPGRRGHVGVGSFYALFAGKQECFLALYDRASPMHTRRSPPPLRDGTPWPDRFCAGLRRLLELAAADADRARAVIVEANTAGPAGEARHAETIAEVAVALGGARSVGRDDDPLPGSFEGATAAGLAWLLHRRLATGRPAAGRGAAAGDDPGRARGLPGLTSNKKRLCTAILAGWRSASPKRRRRPWGCTGFPPAGTDCRVSSSPATSATGSPPGPSPPSPRTATRRTTIAQIATAAGVSRRTFYVYFKTKEDCFLATFDQVAEHLREAAAEAAAAEAEWPAKVAARLGAALGDLRRQPDARPLRPRRSSASRAVRSPLTTARRSNAPSPS